MKSKNKKTERRGGTQQPVTERERQFMQIAYEQGHSLTEIHQMTGRSISAISKEKRDADWEKERIPFLGYRSMLLNARSMLGRFQFKAQAGEIEESQYKISLTQEKLVSSVKSMAEICQEVIPRDKILLEEEIINDLVAEGNILAAEAVQKHHDKLVEQLNE